MNIPELVLVTDTGQKSVIAKDTFVIRVPYTTELVRTLLNN